MELTPRQWVVRRATVDDAAAIAAVASAAWSDTYTDLLHSETIEAFVRSAYSSERLVTRITSNHLYVASGDGPVVAFADAQVLSDRIVLGAIYALPQLRGHGVGTALLKALLAALPPLPMTADVVVGNRKGEVFYERRGFVPRETLHADLFGEAVVERRWWRDPSEPRPDDDDRAAAWMNERTVPRI